LLIVPTLKPSKFFIRQCEIPRRTLRSIGTSRKALQCVAGLDPNTERSLFGENFGARDPTAGEVASNFSEKVLGNFNTEHIIK
jgi:4a-hydroxytetrahydrobiopterin dehydratase